jgi:hypothetical protein
MRAARPWPRDHLPQSRVFPYDPDRFFAQFALIRPPHLEIAAAIFVFFPGVSELVFIFVF